MLPIANLSMAAEFAVASMEYLKPSPVLIDHESIPGVSAHPSSTPRLMPFRLVVPEAITADSDGLVTSNLALLNESKPWHETVLMLGLDSGNNVKYLPYDTALFMKNIEKTK